MQISPRDGRFFFKKKFLDAHTEAIVCMYLDTAGVGMWKYFGVDYTLYMTLRNNTS